ncbi:DUF3108 domain-containing protein [Capnocytophaga catalasegens]|uniref:ATP-dependent exonuclease n=1 Tax=Capnocytophaga catalasegens TaxID=1004260 RepID=A0AAV5B0A3_9FLAO|nr:DUF3108 domain-containing protein [Capnocytophaga catalasegens]GIZ16509.1 hypothetical protein RCZ03_25090 [Capnocytophaga catalasegens]GJM51437.1 hypothetical protein RCZ15_24100 [Capnocytophaga catalasegens]GJM53175.1 hypothetical protein RCZ16_14920 [Capnocytophaga catalasegens]
MKIKAILLTLLYFLANFSFSQEKDTAFKAGEYLKFRVRYGVFNASYATLRLKNHTYQNKEVYHAIGKGETTGLAKLFFKVDDTYESYFDKQTGIPYFFNRDIHEGGYTKKLHFFFDHNKNQVLVKNRENNEEKNINISPSVQDVITALYHFRNNAKMNDLQVGQEFALDMIFDDDEIFKFRLKFLGKERIKTRFGEINTLIFRPLVQNGRVFKEQESLTLWVSDDANKIPVKVKASLRVGSMVGELIDYNGLKHETELKKE